MLLGFAAAVGVAWSYYLSHRPTTEAEIARIESLIVAGRTDEARALMVSAQERSADVDGLRLRVGRAFLHEGQTGPAIALLSRVQGSLIKEEQLAIAEYLLGAGDPFSASRFFEGAMKAGQARTAPLLDRYGQALALAGNAEAAIGAFRECLSLDSTRTGARLNLTALLANQGRLEEARVETLALLKLEPANAKALELLKALDAVR